MDLKYRIVPMSDQHAEDVAILHAMALPRGFLSTLGSRFLGDLYRLIGSSPRSAVWVVELEDGRCIGFLSGTADVKECYRHVFRRGWIKLGVNVLTQAWRPTVLKRMYETVRYPSNSTSSHDPHVGNANVPGELLSVAVSAEARGLGLGRKLVALLDDEMKRWSYSGYYRVVTDAMDPRSNAFYQSLGFAHAHDFLHHGHMMSCYLKAVD